MKTASLAAFSFTCFLARLAISTAWTDELTPTKIEARYSIVSRRSRSSCKRPLAGGYASGPLA